MEICYHMFIYAEFKIINTFFKESRSKYKPAYALYTQHFLNFSCLYRDFSLVVEIWLKVMEKSWKSPGNPLVNMCKNPVLYIWVNLLIFFKKSEQQATHF